MRNACQEWDAAHILRGRLRQPHAGGAILLVKNLSKVDMFLLNVDFLVVGFAKFVAGMGRGAHPARTSKNKYKINVFLFNMACLVVDDANCVPGMGRGAHPARTSIRALPF